jgi:hypothetical protein
MFSEMRQLDPYAMSPYESIATDVSQAAWIGLTWGAGSGYFNIAARLVSLRRDGTSLTCSTPPPRGRRVQISLNTGGKEHTAEAMVAAVRDLRYGLYLVRLIFVAPCGRAFRRAAEAYLDPVE